MEMSKPHAHPYTMKKAHAKFQKDQYKTVRGGTPIVYIDIKLFMRKLKVPTQCVKGQKDSQPHFNSLLLLTSGDKLSVA